LNTTARQVIIANIIGIPAAYYLVGKYLERYSERVSFQWWHYALPLLLLLIIMLSTVASVVWRAAKSNPVDALKCE
jgi:putative ABC transport system permease protein